MKFTCNASALGEGLSIVNKALSSRTTNPVLEGILVETNEDGVLLTCSDERITIRTVIEARVEEHGRGIVQGKLFTEIIRRLTGNEIRVDMSNHYNFRISSGTSRTNLQGQDADLFPALPKIENAQSVTLPQDLLRSMIQRTEFAIAAEDMRECLTGGYLEILNGEISMVALDGFRLALCRSRSAQTPGKFSAIIPGRCLTDIAKLLSDDAEAFVTLSLDGNKLHFHMEKTDIYVILIAGEYIDYRRLLPKAFATQIILEAEPFRRCVDRAALIAREGTNNLLLLKFFEGHLVLEAHSQIGDVREEMDVEQVGDDVNIAFNVRYLIDVVRYIESEKLKLNLNDAIHPCIVTPVDNPDYLHLVLPVRTSATVAG